MSKFLGAANSSIAPINDSNGFYGLGYDNEDDFMGTTGYGQQNLGINPTLDYGSSFLGAASNFFGGKDGMSNLGGVLGGVAGLGQMYLGYQQQKDTAKTNSLYRRLQEEESKYRTKFRDSWSNVSFGGK